MAGNLICLDFLLEGLEGLEKLWRNSILLPCLSSAIIIATSNYWPFLGTWFGGGLGSTWGNGKS